MRTLILRHFVLNRGNSASFEIGIPLIPAPALCPNYGFVVWKKMCNLSNLSSCKQCEVVFYLEHYSFVDDGTLISDLSESPSSISVAAVWAIFIIFMMSGPMVFPVFAVFPYT